MKIALVRQRVGFGLGGAENYVAHVAKELLRRGHEVTVIADYCDLAGVRFLRAPLLGRGSVAKNLSFFLMVRRLVSKNRFDLVYSCARTAPADLLRISDPLHAAWLELGYRFGSAKLRALRPRHRTILWLERQSLSQVRGKVVVNSRLVKGQLLSYYQLPAEKIAVVYNGVDLKRFNLKLRQKRKALRRKWGLSGAKALLFVGSDWRRKGLDLVKKVLPRLPEKAELLVAGGPALRARKGTRFLGPVKEVEELYAAADLFVLPTRYDPFANVVLEALASGLGVVTSPMNGASEIVRPGETGFVVENRPETLMRAISGLLASLPSPKVCHESVAHLTWERHVSEILSLA